MFMNAVILESPERKLVMWYKCNEKLAQGLTKAQIARELGLDINETDICLFHYLRSWNTHTC